MAAIWRWCNVVEKRTKYVRRAPRMSAESARLITAMVINQIRPYDMGQLKRHIALLCEISLTLFNGLQSRDLCI
jgi:hypothetical protein